MKPSRRDLPRFGIATAVGGALGVGLAAVFLHRARSTPDPGPTAGALDDAFSTLFGAGLGLLVGSALAALLTRRGSRLLSGFVAGAVAYALGVAPYLVFTRSSDVGIGEDLGIVAAFFPLYLAPFVILGALLGSLVGRTWLRFRGGGSPEGPLDTTARWGHRS